MSPGMFFKLSYLRITLISNFALSKYIGIAMSFPSSQDLYEGVLGEYPCLFLCELLSSNILGICNDRGKHLFEDICNYEQLEKPANL